MCWGVFGETNKICLFISIGQEERDYAAEQSARVIDAYRTLSKPLSRAIYMVSIFHRQDSNWWCIVMVAEISTNFEHMKSSMVMIDIPVICDEEIFLLILETNKLNVSQQAFHHFLYFYIVSCFFLLDTK